MLALFVLFGNVLEKDTLTEARINIKSRTGEIKGYMKRDILQPDRINIYDKYGNLTGFWVRDTLSADAWVFKPTLSN